MAGEGEGVQEPTVTPVAGTPPVETSPAGQTMHGGDGTQQGEPPKDAGDGKGEGANDGSIHDGSQALQMTAKGSAMRPRGMCMCR